MILRALGAPPGAGIVLGFTGGVLVGAVLGPLILPPLILAAPFIYKAVTGGSSSSETGR